MLTDSDMKNENQSIDKYALWEFNDFHGIDD